MLAIIPSAAPPGIATASKHDPLPAPALIPAPQRIFVVHAICPEAAPTGSNRSSSLCRDTLHPFGNSADLAAPEPTSRIFSTCRKSSRTPSDSAAARITRRCNASGKFTSAVNRKLRVAVSHTLGRARSTSWCQYSSSARAISAVSASASRTAGFRFLSSRGKIPAAPGSAYAADRDCWNPPASPAPAR